MEGEVGGLYCVPFGATKWALRVRALGHDVLSSISWVIAIAEGGADILRWRDWSRCPDLPREFLLDRLLRASFL